MDQWKFLPGRPSEKPPEGLGLIGVIHKKAHPSITNSVFFQGYDTWCHCSLIVQGIPPINNSRWKKVFPKIFVASNLDQFGRMPTCTLTTVGGGFGHGLQRRYRQCLGRFGPLPSVGGTVDWIPALAMMAYVTGHLKAGTGLGELIAPQVCCRGGAELHHCVTRVNSSNAACMLTAL